jgi:hypothetical protein
MAGRRRLANRPRHSHLKRSGNERGLMTAQRGWIGLGLAAGLLASSSGLGASSAASATGPAAAPLDLRYTLEAAGLTVAGMALTVTPEGADIHSELVVRAQGLVQWFSGSSTRMAAISRPAPDAATAPLSFEARYDKRDRTRAIELRWGEGDIPEVARVSSQGRRAKPSEVPAALQRDAVDPLTALARIRGWLGAPGREEGDRLTVPIFDGRKRLDLEGRLLAPGMLELAGETVPVSRLEVKLVPRDGFEQGDGFVSWPDGPQHLFEVLVSQDGRYAPLAVREAGATVVELTADCAEHASACAALAE